MKLTKTGAAVAVGVALAMAVGACSGPAAGDTGTGAAPTSDIIAGVASDPAAVKLLPQSIKQRGYLTMAADLNYPPTSFLAADDKTPVGFNVDIAHLLGKKLRLDVKIENVPFDSVIPGIAGGRYDFTATDMSPTPARLKVLDMITYWNAGSSLVVSKGNQLHLSMADNSICGRTIAVMTGTTQQETYLPTISQKCQADGKQAVNAVILPNVQAALTQLVSKRIDGVFYDTDSLAWAAKQQPQAFQLLSPQYKKPVGSDLVALGLAKNSPLTPALHAAMQSLIDSPQYKQALDQWGLGAGAIPAAQIAQ